jgi:hypothetical protein
MGGSSQKMWRSDGLQLIRHNMQEVDRWEVLGSAACAWGTDVAGVVTVMYCHCFRESATGHGDS